MKQKTHKGAAKRFKITKNKKILERRTPRDHFKARRSSEMKRKLRRNQRLNRTNIKHVRRLLNR